MSSHEETLECMSEATQLIFDQLLSIIDHHQSTALEHFHHHHKLSEANAEEVSNAIIAASVFNLIERVIADHIVENMQKGILDALKNRLNLVWETAQRIAAEEKLQETGIYKASTLDELIKAIKTPKTKH